jgi:hypothetical protein
LKAPRWELIASNGGERAGKAIMVCMGRPAQTYKFGNGDHDGPLFGCVRRLWN